MLAALLLNPHPIPRADKGNLPAKGFDEQIRLEDEEVLKLIEFMVEQGII
jgi:hypothetical protein